MNIAGAAKTAERRTAKTTIDARLASALRARCLLDRVTMGEAVTRLVAAHLGVDPEEYLAPVRVGRMRMSPEAYARLRAGGRNGGHKDGAFVARACRLCGAEFQAWSKNGTVHCPAHRTLAAQQEFKRWVECPDCGQRFKLEKGQFRTYGSPLTPKNKRRPARCPDCWGARASARETGEVVTGMAVRA